MMRLPYSRRDHWAIEDPGKEEEKEEESSQRIKVSYFKTSSIMTDNIFIDCFSSSTLNICLSLSLSLSLYIYIYIYI